MEERVGEFEASLSAGCLERRLGAGLDGADELDLPPWEGYTAGVEARLGPGRLRVGSRYLNAVSVTASRAEAEALLGLPFVSGIRPVARSAWVEPPAEPAPLGTSDLSYAQLAQIGINTLLARGYTGEGVIVGVLDTGFNLSHICLSQVDVLAQWDVLDGDAETGPEPGDPPGQSAHGTAVLSLLGGLEGGIFSGGAFGASFVLAKTEDTTGEYPGEEDLWVAGLEYAELAEADLVSSSLGYIDWYGWEDLDGNTAVTTIAADAAASRGMPVLNAIGNNGPAPGTLIAPADGDSVFAVGGVDGSGAVASFSSRGPTADGRIKPDACARATSVIVASDASSGYHAGSGTSFATPLVASAAALLLEAHPEWNSLQVLDAIAATASQASSPDNDLGSGVVDAAAALTYRSVTGCARRSDTGERLPGYPLLLVIAGEDHVIETNAQGWFAFCPGLLGPFTLSGAGGGGQVIPVAGTLGEQGADLEVFVDWEGGGNPPGAYPVPSESGVWIGFDLASQTDVSVDVFSLDGRSVFRLELPGLAPGSYRAPVAGEAVWWDGDDPGGAPAASGVYIVLLRLGDELHRLKVALVR